MGKFFSLRMIVIILVMIISSCEKDRYPSADPIPNPPRVPRVPVAPKANAGADTILNLPFSSHFLNAISSTDADSNIVSYEWRQIVGPLSAAIRNYNRMRAHAVGMSKEGIYEFELTVYDDDGLSSKDTLRVTVNQPTFAGDTHEIIFTDLHWDYSWIMEIDILDFLTYLPPNTYLKNVYIKRDSTGTWEPVVPLDDGNPDYTFHTWVYGNDLLAIFPSNSNMIDDTPDIKIEYNN